MNLWGELKAGNIVQSKTGVWMVVAEIHHNGITYDRQDMAAVAEFCPYEDLLPVKVTFDMLKENHLHERFWQCYCIRPLSGEGHEGKFGLMISNKYRATFVMYVHQLQNLVNILTMGHMQLKFKPPGRHGI